VAVSAAAMMTAIIAAARKKVLDIEVLLCGNCEGPSKIPGSWLALRTEHIPFIRRCRKVRPMEILIATAVAGRIVGHDDAIDDVGHRKGFRTTASRQHVSFASLYCCKISSATWQLFQVE
jgi:hypothetical protein